MNDDEIKVLVNKMGETLHADWAEKIGYIVHSFDHDPPEIMVGKLTYMQAEASLDWRDLSQIQKSKYIRMAFRLLDIVANAKQDRELETREVGPPGVEAPDTDLWAEIDRILKA